VNTNEPGSSGEATAAADITTQHPSSVENSKQATHKGREAQGQGVQQDASVEQAREVGASGSVSAAHTGGGGRSRRLLLIGLDGATPELAIGAWRTELRTLHLLTDRGARGRIVSSLPWASTPAWLSLLSGQDPGQLGVYGAKRRLNHSYAAPVPIDSHAMNEPRLWDMIGQAGKHVGAVGVPATTPAPQVHGHLIGDRLTAGDSAIYPASLRQQVALWIEDDPPLRIAGADDIDLTVGNAYARTEQRFRLARRLLARDTYDCFVLFDDGIATVERALWDSLDTTHRRYVPNHPSAGAISAFYRFVDEQLADLLELIDDNTIVVVVSACGTQALDGELALNDWLIDQGELRLHAQPDRPAALEECDVDWAHTRAWAGDDGALYLNIAGREPQGAIPAAEAEQAASDLAARLRALVGPKAAQDQPSLAVTAAVEAYRPAALYTAARGVAPDLLALCVRPGWRTSPLVGRGATWISTNAAPMDAACESPTGFFVVYDPGNLGGGRELESATIYDIVPTLLALLGQPIPPRLRGRALIER
jgi:predicted AlkP superfamily phosphohydrolase/phosphomutase